MEVLLSFPRLKISPMVQAQIGHFSPDTAGTKRIPILADSGECFAPKRRRERKGEKETDRETERQKER